MPSRERHADPPPWAAAGPGRGRRGGASDRNRQQGSNWNHRCTPMHTDGASASASAR